MQNVIIGIIVAVAVILVLIVLAQNSKGGGLSGTFGGSGSQVMGAKRTSDFLEKLTWGLAGAILLLSLGANLIKPEVQNFNSPNVEAASGKTTVNPNAGGEQTVPATEETVQPVETEEAPADSVQ